MQKGHSTKSAAGVEKSPGGEDGGCCTCTDGETLYCVCKQCQELICTYCKSTKHRYHEIQTADKVAGEIRNDIQKQISTRTEKMESIQNVTRTTKDMQTELTALQTQDIDDINKTIEDLHRILDEIRADLVKNVTDTVRKDIECLNRTERTLNRTVSSITAMCDTAERMLTEADDIDVIRRGYSLCEELNDTFQAEITKPTKGPAFDVKFIPGTIDHTILKDMIGEVITTKQPWRNKKIDSKSIVTQLGTGASTKKFTEPMYHYLHCREVDVCHKTGILRYVSNSLERPVGQFIGQKPLSKACNKFSIKIMDGGQRSCIAIGVCPANYPPNSQPGWFAMSIGFHADDGGIYINPECPSYYRRKKCVKGDIMECEINFDDQIIYFRKNGIEVDNVKSKCFPVGGFYPMVGFHSSGESVTLMEEEPWMHNDDIP